MSPPLASHRLLWEPAPLGGEIPGTPGEAPRQRGATTHDPLEALFDGFRDFPNALLLLDEQDRIVRANPAAYRLLGARSPGEKTGTGDLAASVERYFPDDLDAFRSLRHGSSAGPASLLLSPANADPVRVDALQRDITLHGDTLCLLQLVPAPSRENFASPPPFRLALDAVRDGVLIAGFDGRISYANSAAQRLLGRPERALLGEPLAHLMSSTGTPAEARQLFEEFRALGYWETIIDGAPGSAGPRRLSLEMKRDPPIADVGDKPTPAATFVATLRDVDPVIDERERLLSLAETDSLTQIANRMGFMRVLERSFLAAKKQATELVILYIDLDNFKFLNDSYGHKYGDELLIAFARRLQASVKAGDLVARLGGDEFVIILHGDGELASGIQATVDRLRERLLQPYALFEVAFTCSASFGSAHYPGDAANSDELLSFADQAMFTAKQLGRDAYCAFDRGSLRENWRRTRRTNAIIEAIEKCDIVPFYQPQYDIFTGRLFGAEALARWINRESGEVIALPDEFIPPISRHPKMIQLGIRMLEAVHADLTRFRTASKNLPVSVNLSPMQLRAEETISYLEQVGREHPTLASRLWLEVTETAFFKRDPEILRNLKRIEAAGMALVLDNFGIGHSSIFSLRASPFRLIKIDRGFLEALVQGDAADRVVLNSMIDLIKALNLQVLCEGVESELQLDYLREHDCDFCQGFLYAQPMPAPEFETLLEGAA